MGRALARLCFATAVLLVVDGVMSEIGKGSNFRLLGKRSRTSYFPASYHGFRLGSLVYPMGSKRLTMGKRGMVSAIAGLNDFVPSDSSVDQLYDHHNDRDYVAENFADPLLGNGQMKAFQSMLTGAFRSEKKAFAPPPHSPTVNPMNAITECKRRSAARPSLTEPPSPRPCPRVIE